MIKALFKFERNLPDGATVIDTTSSSGLFRDLSPFVLPAPPARNFENLWQFSKVYPCHVNSDGEPTEEWDRWRMQGWADTKAHRYPMGKGAKPLYSFWQGRHLDYIEARKQIYIPEYVRNVITTESYHKLYSLYHQQDIVLLDYDAYDYQALGMALVDVVNEPGRKMGHAFVLIMMLEGVLDECLDKA
jgi:hypothetical protein